MNVQLVNSLVSVIKALSEEERIALAQQLFLDNSYPTATELAKLSENGKSLQFLADEPELYTLEDGEPVNVSQ